MARTVHFTHRPEGSVIRHGLTDRQTGHLLDVQLQPREWNGMPLFFVLQAALPSCSSVPVCLTGWQVPFDESRTRRHTGSGGADRKVASEAEWLRSIRPLIPCPADSVSNCSTLAPCSSLPSRIRAGSRGSCRPYYVTSGSCCVVSELQVLMSGLGRATQCNATQHTGWLSTPSVQKNVAFFAVVDCCMIDPSARRSRVRYSRSH